MRVENQILETSLIDKQNHDTSAIVQEARGLKLQIMEFKSHITPHMMMQTVPKTSRQEDLIACNQEQQSHLVAPTPQQILFKSEKITNKSS